MLDTLQWFLYGFIPWEVWLGIAGAAAVATVIYVPNPFRGYVLGAIVAATLFNVGMSRGASVERAMWEAKVAAEQRRLQEGFDRALTHEVLRRSVAEATLKDLQKEVDEINDEADRDTSGAVVVPEPLARRLYDLGTRRPAH